MVVEKCPKCREEYDTLYSSHNCKDEPEKPLGFGWGNFWIITTLIFSTLSILVAIGIYLFTIFYKPENFTIGMIVYLIFMFLFEGLFIFAAIGLLKRKRLGLYLVYSCLGLGVLGIIIKAVEENYVYLLFLVIGYLWFGYFYRRRDWFK